VTIWLDVQEVKEVVEGKEEAQKIQAVVMTRRKRSR